MKYSKTADLLCEMGRFGQKTGEGWYDYQAGKRDAIPSQEVLDKMIDAHRKTLGITPRKISDEEIVQRLVFALVNEGAQILEEGIASKSGDIDMVYLTGYGFPIYRGGPMHYASELGLINVVQAMNRFAQNPMDDAQLLEARTAVGALGRRRQGVRIKAAAWQPRIPIKELHYDIRSDCFHRAHPAGQELEGLVQHDPRPTLGAHAVAARCAARRHRRRRGGRRHHGLVASPEGADRRQRRAPDRHCAPACP